MLPAGIHNVPRNENEGPCQTSPSADDPLAHLHVQMHTVNWDRWSDLHDALRMRPSASASASTMAPGNLELSVTASWSQQHQERRVFCIATWLLHLLKVLTQLAKTGLHG